MDRVGVESKGLAGVRVVRGECVLQELKSRGVVDGRSTVCSIPAAKINIVLATIHCKHTHNQGSIKCTPAAPKLSNWAYIGNSHMPGITGCPLHMSDTAKQSFAMP